MNFSKILLEQLSSKHLLKHPFYQAWSDGTLSKETLRTYAGQYYHHVQAFPRYLSAAHSGCENIKVRQMLLENLIDEERGDENHPELWLRFAKSSFEEGLGVLFAYEHQIPEIARFKLDALKQHYGVSDERGLAFFDVHMKADVYHTQALAEALESLPADARKRAEHAAREGAARLWEFLDGMQRCSAAA